MTAIHFPDCITTRDFCGFRTRQVMLALALLSQCLHAATFLKTVAGAFGASSTTPVLVDNIGQRNRSDAPEVANVLLHPPDLGADYDISCNASEYGAFADVGDCRSALAKFVTGTRVVTFAKRYTPYFKDWMYPLPWRWMGGNLAHLLSFSPPCSSF